MEATVREILKGKDIDALWTIKPGATVYQALEKMAERNIGALPVVQDDTLVGIFSERDYARKITLHGRSSKEVKVKEIMTEDVLGVKPTHTARECLSLMTENHIRHLPVMEEGAMIGIISIGDVVKQIISNQQVRINQLEYYITQKP